MKQSGMLPKMGTLLIGVVLFVALHARANDTSFGDENGSIILTKQPQISMEQERLFISKDLVEVNYVFRNTGEQDLNVPVAFPMPPMHFDYSDHSEIKDFKIWIDDQPIKPSRRLVVRLFTGQDVSLEVAKLGWRERDLYRLMDRAAEPPKGKKRLPKSWFEKDGEPMFTLSEYFTWSQRFPAGQQLRVRHTYAPSVETGVPQPVEYIVSEYGPKTCLDKAGRAGMLRRDREGGVSWGFLRYVLTTANKWNGPIKDFALTIRKEDSAEVISLCLDGPIKKKDPLTFEFHADNFKPERDIAILFVRGWSPEP